MNLLLAFDVGDLFKVLIPVLFVILWVIGQLAGQDRPERKPARKKAGKPEPRPRGGELSQEIEAFLKRAAQKRGDKPAREVEVIEPRAGRRDIPAPARAVAAKPNAPRAAAAMSNISLEKPRTDLRERHFIGDLVEKHLPSQRFAEHTSHLGELADTVDGQMELRIHGKFDHQLGSLAGRPKREKTTADLGIGVPGEPADAIRRMLQTNTGLRQAVVLSEILTPPAHRW